MYFKLEDTSFIIKETEWIYYNCIFKEEIQRNI
jgi:hypothetical protein